MLDIVASIAREAGEQIMRLYERRDYSTYEKPDESPVTSADIAASELIIERLRQEFPDIPVLSEESELVSTTPSMQRYLIDPIDGTQSLYHDPGFCCQHCFS